MSGLIKRWLSFAQADLEAAKVQLNHGKRRGSSYQIAVFHCHQAIEKILKAHLVAQDREVPKTHDLTALRVATGLAIPAHLVAFINALTPHYLLPRYPDLPFEPRFSFAYNERNAKNILRQTKETFLWLAHALTQKR